MTLIDLRTLKRLLLVERSRDTAQLITTTLLHQLSCKLCFSISVNYSSSSNESRDCPDITVNMFISLCS